MISPSEPTIAQRFAGFIEGLRYEDLSLAVVNSAKALVLDQLACELIGTTMPWVMPARRLVQMTEGARGESTIVGSGARCLAADAAFVNASYGQSCELDDSSFGSAGHIGTATVPVALAMGERGRIDGRQFLVSIVAGYEVMYRLMRAIRPHHNSRGFHSQSIGGPFASAAVAGKILCLDANQLTHSLAIAGSHACGPLEYDQSGGEVKRIHAGLAARGGIQSAFLAQFGLTGPVTIIEGKRGFFQLFATQSDPSEIAIELGQSFNISNAMFKMYPAMAGIHPAIAATERLVAEHGVVPADVVRIRVGIAEVTLLHGAGISQPQDVVGAQFSLAFSVALAVSGLGNSLEQYRNARLWNDATLLELMRKVEPYATMEAAGDRHHMAAVDIELRSGRKLSEKELYVKGSPKNPASTEELNAKVRQLAGTILSPERIETLIETVSKIETVQDVSVLADLLERSL
jgi:2-methylcitrate dehydratase PrpD